MTRNYVPHLILGGACILAGVVALSGDQPANADPPVPTTFSTSVTCAPFNALPDGGAGTLVTCGPGGYRAVYLETESTAPAYLCGGTGCRATAQNVPDGGPLAANYTTVGLKRCVDCSNGSAWAEDSYQGQLRCISGTADAGVVFAVRCGR